MIGGWEGRQGGEGNQNKSLSSYVSYNWLILERMPRCEANSSELGLAGWLDTRAASAARMALLVSQFTPHHTTPHHP